MAKKLISLNLALLLLFALLPFGAFAADDGVSAQAQLEERYATFYKNDGSGESRNVTLRQTASNGQITWRAIGDYGNGISDYKAAFQVGWNTVADGSGTGYSLYSSPESLSSDKNNPTKLYAQIVTVSTPAILFMWYDCETADGADYYILDKNDMPNQSQRAFTLPEASEFNTTEPITGWYINGGIYLPGDTFSATYRELWQASPLYGEYVTIHYQQSNIYDEENIQAYYFEGMLFPYIPERVNNYRGEPDEILVGYSSAADGSGTWYREDAEFSALPDDLYAQYEEIPENGNYVILSDEEHGIVVGDHAQTQHILTFTEGGTVTLPAVLADGTFVTMWSDGARQYLAGQAVTVTGGKTLYPRLTTSGEDEDLGNTGIIYGGGGKTADGSEYHIISTGVATNGSIINPEFEYFYKDGHAMTGYKSDKSGSNYSLNLSGEELKAEVAANGSPARFTVQYEAVSAPFVQYVGVGGTTSGGDAYEIDTAGNNGVFTVKDNMFTNAPEGSVFLGWMLGSDERNTEYYDAGDTIDLRGKNHVVLQAVWSTEYKSHKVTYHYTDRNGNEVEETVLLSRVSNPSGAYNKPDSWGERGEDYLIKGWNTEPDGSGEWYTRGNELDPNGDPRVLDLYEQVIHLDQLGGEYCVLQYYSDGNPSYDVVMITDGKVTLPEVEFGWRNTRTVKTIATAGYLDELQTKLSTGTVEAQNGDVFAEVRIKTSTLHKNYGDDDATKKYYVNIRATGSSLQLPSAVTVFGSEGIDQQFKGWNTSADGSGNSISSISVLGYSGTTNLPDDLYAQWGVSETLPQTVTLHFAANGGSPVRTATFRLGETVDLSRYTTEREGYVFAGWYADASLTKPVSKVTMTRSLTVYAKWIEANLSFTDVLAGQWFYESVAYVWRSGLMNGVSATTFEPNANMTRSMLWAILARMDGRIVTGVTWQEAARVWATESGVSDGTDPNGYVTREQFATMLWRYAGEPEASGSLSAYSDADSVSEWAAEAVAWAVENGIVTGVTTTTLVPQGTATRAQAAAMLMRYMENIAE